MRLLGVVYCLCTFEEFVECLIELCVSLLCNYFYIAKYSLQDFVNFPLKYVGQAMDCVYFDGHSRILIKF